MILVGIGTNIGDRFGNIRRACSLMEEKSLKIAASSSIEETDPVDYLDQPRFLNTVVSVETDLDPAELLDVLQSVEKEMKRVKTIDKGPRIIDLDLLIYGDAVLNTGHLTVPHPAIHDRDFILKHIIELDENLVCPLTGKKYLEIYRDKHK